jgi:predicted transcriptional regulator
LSAGKKKIKIQLEDAEGGKYNLSLEGNLSKEKIMKVFELMDVINLGGKNNNGHIDTESQSQNNKNLASVGSKIWDIIENKFPYSTFTSSDILEIYEDEYNEPIQLSIISTYLSRYSDRGKLARNRKGKEWLYKITTRSSQIIESQSNQHPQHIQPLQLSHDVPSTVYDLRQ